MIYNKVYCVRKFRNFTVNIDSTSSRNELTDKNPWYCSDPKFLDGHALANSVVPHWTATRGAVWSGLQNTAISLSSFGCINSMVKLSSSNFRASTATCVVPKMSGLHMLNNFQ